MKNLSPAVGVHAAPACWSRCAKSRLIIGQVCIPGGPTSSGRERSNSSCCLCPLAGTRWRCHSGGQARLWLVPRKKSERRRCKPSWYRYCVICAWALRFRVPFAYEHSVYPSGDPCYLGDYLLRQAHLSLSRQSHQGPRRCPNGPKLEFRFLPLATSAIARWPHHVRGVDEPGSEADDHGR